VDIIQLKHARLKEEERTVFVCWDLKSNAKQFGSLCHTVRTIAKKIGISVRWVRYCQHWAVEMAVRRADIVNLTDHIDEFANCGVRVKVGGEWIVNRRKSIPSLTVDGLKPCSLADVHACLAEIGLHPQQVYHRKSARGGTMSIAVYGVTQQEIQGLRGRVVFHLRNGSTARVHVTPVDDTDCILRQRKRLWGSQPPSSWR
jgi:hypothetical protein